MAGLITCIVLGFLVFVGFMFYFVFKQVQFIIQAVNLYKDMVARLDAIIKLLKDMRDMQANRSIGPELDPQKENMETIMDINTRSHQHQSVLQGAGSHCSGCGKKYEADYSGQFCEDCGARLAQIT